jgi:hypothetical protein
VEVTLPSAERATRRLSFKGKVLWEGIRGAVDSSEEPILVMAREQQLTFVALSGSRLVISQRFHLRNSADGLFTIVIPHMIANHLVTAPLKKEEDVTLLLRDDKARLTAQDAKGPFELQWRSDLHSFPAPPEMARLLQMPADLNCTSYVELSDSIHRAVAKLVDMESHMHIHRTKLAIQLRLINGHVSMDGQEISPATGSQYYFDPRLIMRALESIRAQQVEVGLVRLTPQRAILSIVDRRPECVTHCALLSIGPQADSLFPLARALES